MAPPKRSNARQKVGATPGTYFLSLTVENIRCFGPPQTLDLSDGQGGHAPWTIILGENGLGKTTLLTCLRFAATAAGGEDGANEQLDSRLDKHLERTLERTDDTINLVKWLRRGKGTDRRLFQAMFGTHDGSPKVAKFEMAVQGNMIVANTWQRASIVPPLSLFAYGASRRMPQRTGLRGGDERNSLFLDDDVALRDPEDWLLTADYNARLRGGNGERFDAFAKRVREALIRILPDVADLRIQAADEPGGSPRVEARTPDGWIPLRQLGFGYQSQVAWLVDFASRIFERYPGSADPLTKPAVVLVDEIDLHLHPRWQRQIIGELTELCPKTQFVVTAHSPLIVQAAGDANVVLLRREGDHVVIDNDPEVLENWRIDQILTSELFGLESARPPHIEEPLKERSAILAKGKLTARDRKRLGELEAQIGDLPAGESAEDRRAMELIRQAAAKLSSEA